MNIVRHAFISCVFFLVIAVAGQEKTAGGTADPGKKETMTAPADESVTDGAGGAAQKTVAEKPGQAAGGATATVNIKSKPDDAVVVIDDVMKGRTPLTVENITAGEHVIVLKKDGYFMKKATVSVAADTTVDLTFELIKPLERIIQSTPPGAEVLIDGKAAGITPCTVGKLKPGEHVITLRLKGYETIEGKVTLTPDGPDTLSWALTVDKKKVEAAQRGNDARREKQALVNRVAIGIFLALSLGIIIVELADTYN